MSWSKFTIVIAICYVVYYSVNIIIDMLKGNNSAASTNGGDVLTFTEDIQTTYVEDGIEVIPKRETITNYDSDKKEVVLEPVDDNVDELSTVMENMNISTGGVTNMSDIIKLAQAGTIEFKRSLVF